MSTPQREKYRIASWWLTWEDLAWPDREIAEKISIRAEEMKNAGVNTAVIFGTHFRWDFLPLWERVHGLLKYIADELHEKQIKLFDHHSSVLTHRPRNENNKWEIWEKNRHHIPFYPDRKAVAEWQYNGSHLNDWRMISVQTGKPCYLPGYHAETFCMNNPEFQEAYKKYVVSLVKETGIDGLMSDDAIYYPGWDGCACEYCRRRFKKEYGHTLPPATDTTFWGNMESGAFKDWIEMRYKTTSDFLGGVRSVIGESFPLMTCCSDSVCKHCAEGGGSYQEFIKSTNMVMLEMCGNTPDSKGNWDKRIPDSALHLAIAQDAGVPCVGLGYGFSQDTAFFVWSINKFLGSETWFSTLKGRLGLKNQELKTLPDDPELVSEAYNWEEKHKFLFQGEHFSQIGVFFSRPTRDYYGDCEQDYVSDYTSTLELFTNENIEIDVLQKIPAISEKKIVFLSSVQCLSDSERESLDKYLLDGGIIIATGPVGLRDMRGVKLPTGWLEKYGLKIDYREPARTYVNCFEVWWGEAKRDISQTCTAFFHGQNVGIAEIPIGKGMLLYYPGRIKTALANTTAQTIISRFLPEKRFVFTETPNNWVFRTFRHQNMFFIHGLPKQVKPLLHPTIKDHSSNQPIIQKLEYTEPMPSKISLTGQGMTITEVRLFSPDLNEPRPASVTNNTVNITLPGIRRYFILQIQTR